MKNLIIFIEGPNDKRFFESIVRPKIETQFDCIQFYEYATKTVKQTKNFIKAINKLSYKYIFVKDFDSSVCITQRKQQVLDKYCDCDKSLIQVVKIEIESWYAAGINKRSYKKLRIREFKDCNNVCKNVFEQHLPPKSIVQDKMIDILENYDLTFARKNNNSLDYFFQKVLTRIAA